MDHQSLCTAALFMTLHCEYFPLVPHDCEKSIDGSEINHQKKLLILSKMIYSDNQVKNHLGFDTTWISK